MGLSVASEYLSRTRVGAYFHEARGSRKLVLLIVAVALLLDNMLLTTVGKYQNTSLTTIISQISWTLRTFWGVGYEVSTKPVKVQTRSIKALYRM